MKLGICGDSFMASIKYDANDLDNGYGKHFTELLANKIGWDIITFARGACSNQTIRLQIDEIIKEKPDCVIIGLTTPDRIEFPIRDLTVKQYQDKFNIMNYNKYNGVFNIDYTSYPDKSAENIKFKSIKPTLSSETINNIFFNNHNTKLNKYDIEILEKWFQRFFDFKWKLQQDTWIIINGLRTLMDNNIKFFCINNFIYEEDLSFFKDSIIKHHSKLDPKIYFNANSNVKYRFHTSLEDQELLSNLWFSLFKKHNII